jgi:hypothetical protein
MEPTVVYPTKTAITVANGPYDNDMLVINLMEVREVAVESRRKRSYFFRVLFGSFFLEKCRGG